MPTPLQSMLTLSALSNAAGTNNQVRLYLELQSASDTQAQIAALYAPIYASTAASSAAVAYYSSLTLATSAATVAMETDFENLDLSLSTQISTLFNTITTSAVSGAYTLPSKPAGFATIMVNGSPQKIPYYN